MNVWGLKFLKNFKISMKINQHDLYKKRKKLTNYMLMFEIIKCVLYIFF